jgi:hypothetical protein
MPSELTVAEDGHEVENDATPARTREPLLEGGGPEPLHDQGWAATTVPIRVRPQTVRQCCLAASCAFWWLSIRAV